MLAMISNVCQDIPDLPQHLWCELKIFSTHDNNQLHDTKS